MASSANLGVPGTRMFAQPGTDLAGLVSPLNVGDGSALYGNSASAIMNQGQSDMMDLFTRADSAAGATNPTWNPDAHNTWQMQVNPSTHGTLHLRPFRFGMHRVWTETTGEPIFVRIDKGAAKEDRNAIAYGVAGMNYILAAGQANHPQEGATANAVEDWYTRGKQDFLADNYLYDLPMKLQPADRAAALKISVSPSRILAYCNMIGISHVKESMHENGEFDNAVYGDDTAAPYMDSIHTTPLDRIPVIGYTQRGLTWAKSYWSPPFKGARLYWILVPVHTIEVVPEVGNYRVMPSSSTVLPPVFGYDSTYRFQKPSDATRTPYQWIPAWECPDRSFDNCIDDGANSERLEATTRHFFPGTTLLTMHPDHKKMVKDAYRLMEKDNLPWGWHAIGAGFCLEFSSDSVGSDDQRLAPFDATAAARLPLMMMNVFTQNVGQSVAIRWMLEEIELPSLLMKGSDAKPRPILLPMTFASFVLLDASKPGDFNNKTFDEASDVFDAMLAYLTSNPDEVDPTFLGKEIDELFPKETTGISPELLAKLSDEDRRRVIEATTAIKKVREDPNTVLAAQIKTVIGTFLDEEKNTFKLSALKAPFSGDKSAFGTLFDASNGFANDDSPDLESDDAEDRSSDLEFGRTGILIEIAKGIKRTGGGYDSRGSSSVPKASGKAKAKASASSSSNSGKTRATSSSSSSAAKKAPASATSSKQASLGAFGPLPGSKGGAAADDDDDFMGDGI